MAFVRKRSRKRLVIAVTNDFSFVDHGARSGGAACTGPGNRRRGGGERRKACSASVRCSEWRNTDRRGDGRGRQDPPADTPDDGSARDRAGDIRDRFICPYLPVGLRLSILLQCDARAEGHVEVRHDLKPIAFEDILRKPAVQKRGVVPVRNFEVRLRWNLVGAKEVLTYDKKHFSQMERLSVIEP